MKLTVNRVPRYSPAIPFHFTKSAMQETLTNLSKVLPQLAVLAAVFGFIGWSIRGLSAKPEVATKPGKPLPANDKGRDERVKNLETTLEKERASKKAIKAELDSLKASTVIKESHDNALAELEAAHQSLASESKRTAALETELKRVQETLKGHNSRANDSDKSQKERDFALQNELSKARHEVAALRDRPDDSSKMEEEINRLRESVATSTRFAGELRKREGAAQEELEKLKIQLADVMRGQPAAPARKLGPVGDSNRVAAAKAEVLRLVEKNKRDHSAQAAPAVTDEAPLPIMPAAAVVEPEPMPETPPAPAFTHAVPSENPEPVAPETPVPAPELAELPVEPEPESAPEENREDLA